MEDWRPTSPLLNRRWLNFAQSAPPAWPAPVSSSEEPSVTPPAWLEGAQWQATPETTSWSEPLPTFPSTINDGPIDPPVIRGRWPTPGRSRMGPPFLDEAPQDYPSHLAPVPRAPDWEQVVNGPTRWSPLAQPPRATDWGKDVAGIECRRRGRYANCITPGGREATVPVEDDFPDYLGPGQPNYHYYSKPVGGARVDPSRLMQGVIDNPTPGPRYLVRPATTEGVNNEATPSFGYHLLLGGNRLPLGTPQNPVMSYLTRDQTGALMVVNVTRPGHGLRPGIVVRYVTELPSGATIQNEGTGLGQLQAPGGRLSDQINNVWNAQSREIIDEQVRRSRR